MDERRSGRRFPAAVVIAAAAFACGLRLGPDSDLYLLLLRGMAAARSDFCVNDWFVGLGDYNWAYTWLVAGLAWVWPSPQGLMLALQVPYAALHFMLALAVYRIFKDDADGVASWLVVLAGLWGLCDTSYYSYHFMSPFATPATIAAVLLLTALALLVRKRFAAAILFMAAASVFHLNTFILCAILLCGVGGGLAVRRELSRRIVLAGAVFLLAAAPQVWTILATAAAPADVKAAADHVIVNVRAPHHYQTRSFTLSHTAAAWAPLLLPLASVAYSLLRDGRRALRWPHYLLALCLGVILLNTLLTMVVPVRAVVRLNLSRLLPFAYFLGLCVVGADLVRHLRSGRWSYVLTAVAAVAAASAALPRTFVFAAGLAGLTAVALVWARSARHAAARETLAAVLIAAVVFGPVRNLIDVADRASRAHGVYGQAPAGPYKPVYGWLRENTEPGTVLLTDPGLEGVRLFTERAIVADFKCCPYLPADCVAWYDRVQALTREGITDLWGSTDYARKDLAELRAVADRYGASYILVDSASPAGRDARPPAAYRDAHFTVFRVQDLKAIGDRRPPAGRGPPRKDGSP